MQPSPANTCREPGALPAGQNGLPDGTTSHLLTAAAFGTMKNSENELLSNL